MQAPHTRRKRQSCRALQKAPISRTTNNKKVKTTTSVSWPLTRLPVVSFYISYDIKIYFPADLGAECGLRVDVAFGDTGRYSGGHKQPKCVHKLHGNESSWLTRCPYAYVTMHNPRVEPRLKRHYTISLTSSAANG
ncbi:hypothetical protein SUGI_0034270 [Cryptomeria japonica]|nr:hypothetical protein SUGI_0034270 [Cryptomeria japonica]